MSQANQVVIPSWLAAWPGKVQPFKTTQALMDIRQAAKTSHNKSILINYWQ